MNLRTVTFSVVLGLAGTISAQGAADAAASKLDQVRSLYKTYAAARDKADEEMKALSEQIRNAERGSAEQRELSRKAMTLRQSAAKPQKEFTEAFVGCDWKQFDATADAELLKAGLPAVAKDIGKSPELALAAGKYFVDHFKDDKGAAMVMLNTGDLLAATGKPDEARKLYEQAATVADQNTMNYVTLRKELIGKPAPDVKGEQWIGAPASSLSALKGNVVLVDFWATWCGPCRHVMPALNELYNQHKAEGLQVIGVTRVYDYGYLPANESQMQTGGKNIPRGSLAAGDFAQHVTDFRTNTGIDYPFVIGDKSNFDDYHVKGIPTLAVIDRAGNVALVCVGSGSEDMLKLAVQNLLKAKK